MNGRAFEVIIDELVLYGVAVIDRERFRLQVEQELGRIMQQEGGLPDIAGLSEVNVVASPQTAAVATGQIPNATEVARAILGALKR